MRQQQPHQFFADIAGRTDDGDFRFLAAEDSRLYSFFHNAQCVFRLDLIATNNLEGAALSGRRWIEQSLARC